MAVFFQSIYVENNRYIKAHPALACLLVLLSYAIAVEFYMSKCVPIIDEKAAPVPFKIFHLRWCIVTIPAIFYVLIWIYRKASAWLTAFWREMDSVDRRIYCVLAVVLTAVILILYVTNSQWYLIYDDIYSIDSGWCYEGIFPDAAYYDVRHPALSVITFPIWAITHFWGQLLFPPPLTEALSAVCLQVLNIQLILLMGMMIGKLAHSRWVTILYYVSAPVLLFVAFFEKYQICTFFVVAYVYQLCCGQSREMSLIVGAGSMPTNILIVLGECFSGETWKKRGERLLRLLAAGVAFMICFGRAGMLIVQELFSSVANITHIFGLQVYQGVAYLYSFINLAQGTLLPLPSCETQENVFRYMWDGITERISFAGPIILCVVLIGLWSDRKESFAKICAVWIAVAALLFMVMRWSVGESPLFSLCFSWAFLPLFYKGLRTVCIWLHWKEAHVMPFFTVYVMAMNLANTVYITKVMA